jgi:hypothetical protein
MPSFNVKTQFSSLYLIVDYTIGQYSIEKNTTPVTIKLYLHHGGLQVGAGTDDCSVWVGRNKVTWTGPAIYDSSGGTVHLGTKTVTVTHNADGTWSGKIGGSERLNVTYSGTYIGTISGEQSITLPPIPRASTIAATDANIGSRSTVVVNRKASAFTHTIQYKFGSLTGYIDGSGNPVSSAVKLSNTTILFAVPDRFYAQIPNAATGKCTLTCTTYSGNTKIGDAKTTTFTVTASPALCAPDITATVQDTNEATLALTGDADTLVRYCSTASGTFTATAKNSATIKQKTILGTSFPVGGTTYTIANVNTNKVTFAATDSRGYTTQKTVEKALVSYIGLTCNIMKAYRPNPAANSGRLEISGQWFNGNFGLSVNTLLLHYKLSGADDWTAIAPTISGNTYSCTVDIADLDYRNDYSIDVEAVDLLQSKTVTGRIMAGVPIANWGKDKFNINVAFLLAGVEQDAMTDSGTSGIWTYRKYASGLAVCWGSTDAVNIAQSDFTAWGSWYSGTITSGEAFPFKFVAPPHMLREVSNPWGSGLGNYTSPTAANTGKVALIRPNAQAVSGVQVHFLAIGRWK